MIRLIFIVSAILLFSFICVFASNVEEQECKHEFDCQTNMNGSLGSVLSFKKAVKTRDIDTINIAIDEISMISSSEAWKDAALGLLHMLKGDAISYEVSEIFLKRAYTKGSKKSAQNLAILYFHMQKYSLSYKYLNIVKGYNYQFPSIEYINWARLHAEYLYIGLPELQNQNKVSALRIFNQIKDHDDTGISHYFLGYDAFFNKKVKEGLVLLVKSSDMEHLPAILLLGDIYFIGKNTVKDLEKARFYYLKGIEQSSGHAHYYLAMIYKENGNPSRMKKHLTLAAQLGNKEAIKLYYELLDIPDSE